MEKYPPDVRRTGQLASSLPYFLALEDTFSERDLEAALIRHIKDKRDHFAAIRPTLIVEA